MNVPKRIKITDNTSFDIHCHIFNKQNVPNGFVGIRLPWTRKFFNVLENLVRWVGKVIGNEEISNVKYFLELFVNSQEILALKLFEYYSKDTVFCPLLMDMAPSIKGKIRKDFNKQINEVSQLVKKYPGKLLPFVHINPLSPFAKNIFDRMFVNDDRLFTNDSNTFWGVKIYPSLGHLPSHPALIKVFQECEARSIPITVHCSTAIVHTTEHHFTEIPYEVLGPDGKPIIKYEKGWFWTKADYAWFNDPKHWETVLQRFPKLRLNLAHFGGFEEIEKFFDGSDKSWVHRIISLMQRYPNVYSDIAFSLFRAKYHPNLRNLLETNQLVRERLMYGSDYYMVTLEGHFRGIKSRFETNMGSEIMKTLSVDNPKKFLF